MTRRHVVWTAGVGLVFVLAACSGEPTTPEPDPDPDRDPGAAVLPMSAVATVTATDVAHHVGVLADDSMKGRGTPSPGLEAAAGYIATVLQQAGLDPAGTSGYLQRFSIQVTHLDTTALVLEPAGGGGPALAWGRDYVMFGSRNGNAVGPLLWGGDATSTPDAGGRDMTGRVVLYDLPATELTEESVQLTSDADGATQLGGAVAVGFVVPPGFSEEAMARAARWTTGWSRTLPTFWIREPAAMALLGVVGVALDSLRGGGPQALEASLHVRGMLLTKTADALNVVARLPGSDPSLKNEYVVLSAHFDHLGVGLPDAQGDSIFNGTDDNASGTAAVLEVAQALASLDTAPPRSVLFVLVSAEELGLIGSTAFLAAPTVPASAMVADINMDMVGRNAPGTIIDVGGPYSTMGTTLRSLAGGNGALGLTVIDDPTPEEHLFQRSDQFSFACKGVPAILLHSGLHADYHTPSDELARLDTDKVARVARLALYLAWDVANAAERPQWTDAGRAFMAQARCR